MSGIATVAAAIFKHAAKSRRFVVAIAGPPGAGKSTVAEQLVDLLPKESAAVVPLVGFHYDDAVLTAKGLRQRKGAPETFDFDGYEALLKRLRSADSDVAICGESTDTVVTRSGRNRVIDIHEVVCCKVWIEGNA